MFGHVTDIGGRVPGSMPTDARQIYEEGILIPPTKIVREGEPRTDLIDLIMHNCRVPQWNRADLSALVSSADLAERRVHEICRRFGVETYLATINLLLARNRTALADSGFTVGENVGGGVRVWPAFNVLCNTVTLYKCFVNHAKQVT